MDILLIEPYFTGSHARWAEGYKKASGHNIEILSMEGRYWKWRMHGGAVTLARRFNEGESKPSLILATDMLDLTTFLALTRERTAGVPAAIYFHENQLTYPWGPNDRDAAVGRDQHYGFINYASALAADSVFFNSRFHMNSFLDALAAFLKGFPEYNEAGTIEAIKEKSSVLHLGMDFSLIDSADAEKGSGSKEKPLILWNHRWEHDKNPEEFFRALYAMDERGLDFSVALLGENFRNHPAEFEEARKRLGGRIIHSGFVENSAEYAKWLKRADILPVTSVHDFFGASVVEAVRAGCFPLLPARLAYPEHFPEHLHELFFYNDFDGLVDRLASAIANIDKTRGVKTAHLMEKYGWERMAPAYDREMERVARLTNHRLFR